MSDVIAVVLTVIVPVVVVIVLAVLAPSRRWAAEHPRGARRSALLGGALGVTVAAFWVGRVFALW